MCDIYIYLQAKQICYISLQSKCDKIYRKLYYVLMKNAIKLDVPYRSQLDNEVNPTGACNVTSVAMCLLWGGVTLQCQEVQLEDELYGYMEKRNLNRHDD